MIKLADGNLRGLLPQSIADDSAMVAAAEAVAPHLRALAQAVPNLLIYARLGGQDPARMLAPLRRLIDSSDGLKAPETELLEALAWQFHVDFRDVATTDAQLASMVRQSILWHRIKGTPASIKAALSLFGYAATLEEDGPGKWWATYQVGLPQIATVEEVRHIYTVASSMAPARCRLWRMYTDVYDRRPIVLGNGPQLGDGWLSFYSGVPVSIPGTDDEVLVSFGVKNSYQSTAYLAGGLAASFGAITHLGAQAPYLDTFVLGRSRLGSPAVRNHGFVIGALFSILWAERHKVPRAWRGTWDDRRWLDHTGYDRVLPSWRMERRSFSRSQIVPGWGDALADTNARLGATFAVVVDNPPHLGAARLSDHDCQRRVLRLHEMFINVAALTTSSDARNTPAVGMTAWRVLASSLTEKRPPMANAYQVMGAQALGEDRIPTLASGQIVGMQTSPATAGMQLPVAVRGVQAGLWSGGWTVAGRTWGTTIELSTQ